jgi:hypothetical protein
MSTWKDKITQIEITPPDSAWTKISNRRKFAKNIKWGIGALVIAGAALTYQQFRIAETPIQTKVVTTASPAIIPSTEKLSQENNIESNSIAKTESKNSLPLATPTVEQTKDETPILNPYPFPYNGSVHSRSNTADSSPHVSERTSTSDDSSIIQEETETPTAESTEIELPTVAEHHFVIADHFSPNQDGWNDSFSPALQLPEDFKFIQWSLFRNQQWIRSWNENIAWDGNDQGGYPMEVGTYTYILSYEDDQHVVHTQKGSISLQR